jgi:hypothetical protein
MITSNLQSSNKTNFIATIAKFTLIKNKELSSILARAGFSLTHFKLHNQVLSEDTKESIAKSINDLLSNIDSLTIKINIAIQVFNGQRIS